LPSTDVATFSQIFFDRGYDFDVARQPRVIIDGGANIGLSTIFFANRFPDARIIAVEPERSNFELLEWNTANYPNVEIVQAGLWNVDERLQVSDPGTGFWGFRTTAVTPGLDAETVPAVTVPTLLDMFDLDRADILKLDIEGAEREVFTGSESWIERVDGVIVELHDRLKPGCARSFYSGTPGFDLEWQIRENTYVTRNDMMVPPPHVLAYDHG